MRRVRVSRTLVMLAASAALTLSSCQASDPATDADIIVVGAGIAGLSAALEAESHGARVLVVEANSMAGGHAVKAGGLPWWTRRSSARRATRIRPTSPTGT